MHACHVTRILFIINACMRMPRDLVVKLLNAMPPPLCIQLISFDPPTLANNSVYPVRLLQSSSESNKIKTQHIFSRVITQEWHIGPYVTTELPSPLQYKPGRFTNSHEPNQMAGFLNDKYIPVSLISSGGSFTTDEGRVITSLGYINRILAKVVTLKKIKCWAKANNEHIVSQSAIRINQQPH
ncbi:uncharacterized protein BKA55DRAFT_671711 [Fusarium redolens]|uniref:Uncharacterized protein n=1 Tax=Fusarium redolens TaxID=48865 RepID=A0A9P9HXH6_FUSRE|nr:uncharacterized protein BKA55DRAFT_671711 [Fusarium redolens]KAH7264742.1 hypothetical protein BKA55DRAFT_671711 [Fusarium redolens]